MAKQIVAGALLAGKLATKKALKLLKDHGHKAKVKGDKIKAVFDTSKTSKKTGKIIFQERVETLPKEPTLKRVRDFLGYKKGGRVGLKSGGLAKRGKGCEIK